MSRLKVATVVGTRPEIIRLSNLIKKLDQFTHHTFVHTGQNYDYELNQIFFSDLGLRAPDVVMSTTPGTFGSMMGQILMHSESLFRELRPDAVVILGDTNSSIAALAAERLFIPVYHLEAGNRSFDANVPEELNRRLIDHVASFNLPYNEFSLTNLLNEGIEPRFTMKTGSPIREIFESHKSRILESTVLERLDLADQGFFLASIHRQETVDASDRLQQAFEEISDVAERWDLPVILSTHPRTKAQLSKTKLGISDKIRLEPPFGYLDYNKLQLSSKVVISDSGTVFEESNIMGFRAVCLRDATERPESFEVGGAIMTGIGSGGLAHAVELALSSKTLEHVPDGYGVTNFSDRVLKFIISTAPLHRQWKGLSKS